MPGFRWIADADVSAAALWAALILGGLTAGLFASRWNAPGSARRGEERLLLAAAALAVVAWFTHAGSLIGSSVSSRLLAAHVPISVEAGYRLAALWATLPGAALTFATALLVRGALAGRPARTRYARYVATLSVGALLALGIAAWFAPSPNATSSAIPPFVQAPAAALAPLVALAAVAVLADVVAARIGGVPLERSLLRVAWIVATIALVAEQVARSRLGISPRDAILLGSASSGLVLWLLSSALLHRRVQALVFRIPVEPGPATPAAMLAHGGAILVALSFALHAGAARTTVAIPSGATVDVRDAFKRTWQLSNQGVSRFDEDGADVLSLALEVAAPSGATALLTPEIHEYHSRSGEHLDNTIGHRRSTGAFVQTMRVLLVGADSLDVASVRVTFLPVPILWPLGVLLLGVSMLFPRGESRNESRNE